MSAFSNDNHDSSVEESSTTLSSITPSPATAGEGRGEGVPAARTVQPPTPKAPMPWTQVDETTVVRDANGAPVSFTDNAPFVMHCVSEHIHLMQALGQALVACHVANRIIAGLNDQPIPAAIMAMLAGWQATLNRSWPGFDPVREIEAKLGTATLVPG